MADSKLTEKSFSRHAGEYDRYCQVQNHMASRMMELIDTDRYDDILDIGCGTGNYTALLRKKFARSNVTALDISAAMIDIARRKEACRGIEFVVCDAEEMNFAKKFDLVTSNACLQWLGDFSKAMLQCKGCLKENGQILFSFFGPATFSELSRSLKVMFGDHVEIESERFADKYKINSELGRLFNDVKIEEKVLKQEYNSILDLLKTIKYTGTRGAGLDGIRLDKPAIAELDRIYRTRWGRIIVTYEVFYFRGRKRGSNI